VLARPARNVFYIFSELINGSRQRIGSFFRDRQDPFKDPRQEGGFRRVAILLV
jgi:hypothetical protein